MAAINEFARMHDIAFKTDAIIEIVKVACTAVGIDISNLPEPKSNVDLKEPNEDEYPDKTVCPETGRTGGFERCQKCPLVRKCSDVPPQWRRDLIGVEPEEDSEQEETNPFLETFFTCPITKEATKVKKLPCIEDPEFGASCRDQKCLEDLKRRIQQ